MSADFSELWRRKTLESADIRALVGDRVYPRHISSVAGATYPAISLFNLGTTKKLSVISGQYQMDTWAYNEVDARHLQDYLEQIWNPEYISKMPTGSGVHVMFLEGPGRSDGAFEDDIKLFHKIGIYLVAWRAS